MTHALTIEPLGELELVMTRVFDAPRERVFDAWTRPELLSRWLGIFDGMTMPVCEIDLREGGGYRYVWELRDGTRMGVRGVYQTIRAPELVVCTEVFDDAWYEGEALITHVLEEIDAAATRSRITIHYASREARDGVLNSPMQHGVRAGYAVLDDLLESQE